MKCICKKCGKVNIFPDEINPETYGWTFMPDDTMYCFRCDPEGGEEWRKNFANDLEDYIGLINMRLVDISTDIQDLSSTLDKLGKELKQINNNLKGNEE